MKVKEKAVKVKTKVVEVLQKWLYSPDGKSCQLVDSSDVAKEAKLKSEGFVELDTFEALPKWMHAPDGKSGQLVETPAQFANLERHGWLDAPPEFYSRPEDVQKAKVAQAASKKTSDKDAKDQSKADKKAAGEKKSADKKAAKEQTTTDKNAAADKKVADKREAILAK